MKEEISEIKWKQIIAHRLRVKVSTPCGEPFIPSQSHGFSSVAFQGSRSSKEPTNRVVKQVVVKIR